ncbi:type II toxin-antitoxin system RelB/DinJ family antitoxin [Arcanobacterium hippocoleae]|uniref:DNA-damage-inducible protein J n=1 Tax=Arcanobacterium hippocoleae TaxID=149017 RepID=A0ABU1T2Q4_9ACTO|nr:type II toxin-antitoxin system RelB/DinJ family antitoxin [Arcanobacterium hippocoleae]MDR6939670.1 DNA-damage-inducible protein J [Arcanobacterium hippocoleae]
MATVPTQIRIDADVKIQATQLFSKLGLDMSSAVNVFLRQCLMRGGLPFDVAVLPNDSEIENVSRAELNEISERIITRNAKVYNELAK